MNKEKTIQKKALVFVVPLMGVAASLGVFAETSSCTKTIAPSCGT